MPITCNYIWLLDDSSCGNAGTGLASHSSNSIRLIIKLMLIDCSLYASLFLSFFLSLSVFQLFLHFGVLIPSRSVAGGHRQRAPRVAINNS